MSPISSTLAGASARGYGGLGASVASAAAGSYESIASYTVGSGGVSTITFNSIPQTYKHLQIRAITRASAAGVSALGEVKANNDSTSGNYVYYHLLTGDQGGSLAAYFDGNGAALGFLLHTVGNGGPGNYFSPSIFDIPDYTNTNKWKTFKSQTGFLSSSESQSRLTSTTWKSLSAVDRLDLSISGSNFMQHSQVALYGIKG